MRRVFESRSGLAFVLGVRQLPKHFRNILQAEEKEKTRTCEEEVRVLQFIANQSLLGELKNRHTKEHREEVTTFHERNEYDVRDAPSVR
jgi:hypothetical protein